jgi:VWFA-related protein
MAFPGRLSLSFRKNFDMPPRWTICTLLVLAMLTHARRADSQGNAANVPDEGSIRFRVPVDEVSLTFHAADAHGLPVNDLKRNELNLLDNGKPPRRVLDFHVQLDFPIRAGILMDTSESTEKNLSGDRAIAGKIAQRLLRQPTDQAFVLAFGYISTVTQTWTGDQAAVAAGVRNAIAGRENPLGGTAIFDAVFRACHSEFGAVDHAAGGNFIVLFSDGEDNASHGDIRLAVDTCQHANTAIYVFRAEPVLNSSSGPKNLMELASETGGRVFHDNDSEAGIEEDLRIIEAERRNQYVLVYKPAELRHDGSFHRIELSGPDRAERIAVRSGYYAPAH